MIITKINIIWYTYATTRKKYASHPTKIEVNNILVLYCTNQCSLLK